MKNQPLLQIKNLNLGYGHKKVLRDLSLELYPGEILGIVGSSGGGKALIKGHYRPASCQCDHLRRPAALAWARSFSRRFQTRQPAGTGNIHDLSRPCGVAVSRADHRCANLYHAAGAGPQKRCGCFSGSVTGAGQSWISPAPSLFRQLPCQLSGGMNQRCLYRFGVVVTTDTAISRRANFRFGRAHPANYLEAIGTADARLWHCPAHCFPQYLRVSPDRR